MILFNQNRTDFINMQNYATYMIYVPFSFGAGFAFLIFCFDRNTNSAKCRMKRTESKILCNFVFNSKNEKKNSKKSCKKWNWRYDQTNIAYQRTTTGKPVSMAWNSWFMNFLYLVPFYPIQCGKIIQRTDSARTSAFFWRYFADVLLEILRYRIHFYSTFFSAVFFCRILSARPFAHGSQNVCVTRFALPQCLSKYINDIFVKLFTFHWKFCVYAMYRRT